MSKYSQPLVSINIRTYNNSKTIGKTLESIKKQSYKKIETIVADGHSKDDTVKILKKYKVKILDINYKKEDPRIVNYEQSRGKYIFTVDADQVLDHDLVEKCVKLAEKQKLDAVTISEKSLITKNTLIEKLIAYDKRVIDKNEDDDSLFGTARPRFFRKECLADVVWPQKFSMFDDTLIYDDLLAKYPNVAYLSSSSIWHHEVTSWQVFIKKFHWYGKSYIQAFLKKPTVIAVHSLPRRSYFSKAALSNPAYFIGLLLLYLVKATAAASGVLAYLFQKNMGIILVGLVVFLSYLPLLNGYFQQDEWASFAYNFAVLPQDIIQTAFSPNVGHYQPLNTVSLYLLISIFQTNYLPYAITSLALHIVCVFLVFALVKNITKDRFISLGVAFLFGILASTYQATTWVMADLGIHLSTVFALVSLLYFVRFIRNEKPKDFKLSIVLLLISLLFKETAIGFFAVLPICFFLFASKKLIKQRKYPLLFIGVGALYLVLRIIMTISPSSAQSTTLAFATQTPFQVFYNILSFPFKGFAQSIIPSQILISVSQFLAEYLPVISAYKPQSISMDLFAQKYVLEFVSYVLFLLFCFTSFAVFKSKKLFEKKLVVVAFLFVFFNGLIYGLSPERIGIITDLDSRNLYLISIGSCFVVIFSLWKSQRLQTRTKFYLLLALFVFNLFLLETRLIQQANDADQRKYIINQVITQNRKLPAKVVFFIESDKSYYGLPPNEKILPFQSGFGHTLLVLYFKSEEYLINIFDNRFLWDIASQGYKETGGRGFGYYREFELLANSVIENNLSVDSVVAYRYDSKRELLSNITPEVRAKLDNLKYEDP